jgi:hypothetical protein
VGGEELVDRLDQLGDAVEDAAAERFVGELAEPAFDEVEPRARGRDEVEMEAGVFREPRLDVGVFVGAVVVDDQVEFAVTGKLAVEGAEELEELSWWRWRGRHCPITLPSRTLSAANSVVVPLRL